MTDIGGWSGKEHQVEWRSSSWVENIKLGGEYKAGWRNVWWTQVGDEHGGWSGLEHQVEWRTSSWVENIKLGVEHQSGWRI